MAFHGFSGFFIVVSWFIMKLYFKELDYKELGVLGYILGVLSYSDLLGLGVPDEWLLDLLVERPWAPWGW